MILKNIRALCDENDISISALEKELGIGNGTLSHWDSKSPRVDLLKKVADYFGVSIEYFLDESEERTK